VLAFTSWIADRAGAGGVPLLFCSRDGVLPLEADRRLAPRWKANAPAQYFQCHGGPSPPALAGGLRAAHRELLCGGRRPRSTAQLFTRVGLGQVPAGGVRGVGCDSHRIRRMFVFRLACFVSMTVNAVVNVSFQVDAGAGTCVSIRCHRFGGAGQRGP